MANKENLGDSQHREVNRMNMMWRIIPRDDLVFILTTAEQSFTLLHGPLHNMPINATKSDLPGTAG